ncbi:hypothetical protein A3737_26765, partial [Oleiphilus sp. HI0065]
MTHQCSCPCGKTAFTVEKPPFARFYCHCEICQKLYDKAYSDVTIVRSKHVHLEHPDVDFKKYRLPPALDRGTCKACGKPAAGFLKGIPGLGLAFITADNFHDASILPKPLGHVFYHRKQAEVNDALPKVSGYFSSEIAVCK